MIKPILVTTLFILSCFCVVNGRAYLGTDGNPITLFLSLLAMAGWYIYILRREGAAQALLPPRLPAAITGALVGMAGIAITVPSFDRLFEQYNNPGALSDVITQLDVLYTRYTSGVFPYYPLEEYSWHPYPVYMPLNWLPLAISHLLKVDNRWVGILLMLLANGLWGAFVWRHAVNIAIKIIAILLPVVMLLFYTNWAGMDISVSLETMIAAYYMVLAIGLASKNIYLITAGLILCLLSRYTMIFWLPLFAIIYWQNIPRKANIGMWAAVALAFLVFYILPFYIKDPSILKDGVAYHNHCAIEEWKGYGEERISYTFVPSIYFAAQFRNWLPGAVEQQVFIMRVIQGSLMILLNIAGLLYHRKNKARMDYAKFCLVMLFLFLIFFYMFSPLLYKYYHIVTLSMAAIIGSMILLSGSKGRVGHSK